MCVFLLAHCHTVVYSVYVHDPHRGGIICGKLKHGLPFNEGQPQCIALRGGHGCRKQQTTKIYSLFKTFK